jgi:D-alanine-D-alanine ligase
MKNKNLKIGVFFGGKSPEHDVSIITGQLIISELKKMDYDVMPIYINKNGGWFIGEELGELKFFNDAAKMDELKKFSGYFLDVSESREKMIFKKGGIYSKKIEIDLAFPAFHGANGEDGTIQGIFEMLNVPYVGCDVPSSAMAMDKTLTKLFYKNEDIATTKFIHFTKKDWLKNKNLILSEIKKDLNWPIFIKPARLGSSIGMAKIKKYEDLEFACEVALHYDNKILAEESVEDLADITCAVMGNDNPKPSLIQESVFSGEHFSYEDKYLEDGGAQLGNAQNNIIIPARLDEETTKKVQDLAVKIFKMFGCAGIARIDFLYDKKSRIIYANEINPLPGTLYHHLWEKSGVKLDELIENLIQFAIERHKEKNEITYTFESDLLKQAKGMKLRLENKFYA